MHDSVTQNKRLSLFPQGVDVTTSVFQITDIKLNIFTVTISTRLNTYLNFSIFIYMTQRVVGMTSNSI